MTAAVQIAKKISSGAANGTKDQAAKIVVVDKNDYHLYHPNLYEVATAEEEFTSLQELKKSIALQLRTILPKNVEFVQGTVEAINIKDKTVLVSGRKIDFDYLVVSLGSTTDFFNIPGMVENSMALKSVPEAIKIRNECELLVESRRLDMSKELIRFVIGGGGFTGVELAGEMANFLQILEWKYNYPPKKLEITVLEATSQLLPGMPADLSDRIYWRLKDAGVQIRLDSIVSAVEKKQIRLKNGEIVNFDLLVWTGGVKSVPLQFVSEVKKDSKGRVCVDSALRLQGTENIFIVGDCACVMGADNKALPATATQAIKQAQYVAQAISDHIEGLNSPPFKPSETSYIITVKGKWSALHLSSGQTFYGFLPWLVRKFADVRYFWQLMPLAKALRLVWFETRIYSRND